MIGWPQHNSIPPSHFHLVMITITPFDLIQDERRWHEEQELRKEKHIQNKKEIHIYDGTFIFHSV